MIRRLTLAAALLASATCAAAQSTPTTQPAATQPRLVIVKARWGLGNQWEDVTKIVQSKVQNDHLQMRVQGSDFPPIAGQQRKTLILSYTLDGVAKTAQFRGQTDASIGPPDALTADPSPARGADHTITRDGKTIHLDQRLAELRKKYPTGLIVLDARFGADVRWKDVTDQLQQMVNGNGLAVFVGHETFGEVAGGAIQELQIWYAVGNDIKYQKADEGKKWGFGDAIAELAQGPDAEAGQADQSPAPARGPRAGRAGPQARGPRAGRAGNAPAQQPASNIDDLRKTFGDGLIIVSARWSLASYHLDETETLQDAIVNNHLAFTANDDTLGNPFSANTGPRSLQLTYWDGTSLKRETIKQGNPVDLTGELPDLLKSLPPPPAILIEGQPAHANLTGAGSGATFAFITGPTGMTVSPTGEVSWTPARADAGRQRAIISVKKDNKESFERWDFQVAPAAIAAEASNDPARIAALLTLPLADKKHEYATGPDTLGGALIDGQHLRLLGPDGTSVTHDLQLAKAYERIGLRDGYVVGVRTNPMILDILDNATGKVTRTVPLSYQKLMDVALMPGKPRTFVAVQAAQTVPRDRIVIVNETTGQVTTPRDLAGSFLAFDRTGRHLWVGLRDLYENGSQFFIDPAWNIIETPTYGNIDMLLRFDVTDSQLGLRQSIEEAGGNGSGVRVSPDGKRVTYLSFTGYPLQSKDLPAWDAMDLNQRPVEYPLKDRADTAHLCYHPVLPLVVVPAKGVGNGVILLNRDTGDTEDNRIAISPLTFAGTRVHDAFFSPDGLSVIADCQRAADRFLYRVPLILSDAEKSQIKSQSAPLQHELPLTPGRSQTRADVRKDPTS
ncbi:MAG TPA: hypothetical protein VH253_07200 [Phycisphaerae bacterium]|nr:hypothetical protein [Phycisphaerae bacterium]